MNDKQQLAALGEEMVEGLTDEEMARCEDTGGYRDPELLAMWCGWELGWSAVGARGGRKALVLHQELLGALEALVKIVADTPAPDSDDVFAVIAEAREVVNKARGKV